MTTRRSERVRRPIVHFEEKEAPATASDTQKTTEIRRQQRKTVVQEVLTESLPEQTELPALPNYDPPIKIEYRPSRPIATGLSILQSFLLFLTPNILDLIVAAINTYAVSHRIGSSSRSWKPVNQTDIWRYLGCYLYMGLHYESQRVQYWSDTHQLGSVLGLKRFEQIHRYFSLHIPVPPQPDTSSVTCKLGLVGDQIRLNCIKNWIPSSHLCIDEAMVPFYGRSAHTTKMKNKPISQGFKVWAMADQGYTFNFLWHSHRDGPEGMRKQGIKATQTTSTGNQMVKLAPTYAVIILLAQQLRNYHPTLAFGLYLDNLFLTIIVAQALLFLNIGCTGTTRKNAEGIPLWLIDFKNKNQRLLWNTLLAEIVDSVLVFLWQDNNAVLGMTTCYNLKETVTRVRKRPKITSTNGPIIRPVFGDEPQKRLKIPQVIDDYNHFMGGVDTANQLRQALTIHRKFEKKGWHPQWCYLFDVCLVNSYLIFNFGVKDPGKRTHREFQEELAETLMNWQYPRPQPPETEPQASMGDHIHEWEAFQKRGYCQWCPKQQNKRKRTPLGEIEGNILPKRVRPSQSRGGCMTCGVCLCQGGCFEQFHRQNSNIRFC